MDLSFHSDCGWTSTIAPPAEKVADDAPGHKDKGHGSQCTYESVHLVQPLKGYAAPPVQLVPLTIVKLTGMSNTARCISKATNSDSDSQRWLAHHLECYGEKSQFVEVKHCWPNVRRQGDHVVMVYTVLGCSTVSLIGTSPLARGGAAARHVCSSMLHLPYSYSAVQVDITMCRIHALWWASSGEVAVRLLNSSFFHKRLERGVAH